MKTFRNNENYFSEHSKYFYKFDGKMKALHMYTANPE